PQNQTDPQAIVFYEVAQVLPLVLHPPALFVLGPVDVPFGNESSFAIGFRLTQGSSPAPLPAGAFGSIQYDGAYTPSFVYVPWYAPDPPKPTFTPRPTSSSSTSKAGTLGGSTSGSPVSDDDKDSPGFALPLGLVALLAAAAFAARRRTR
ncbi:MAG: PGF-CTERM sorting domain-containing protein, partial [Candidatus Thermoplasmatota archaeon]